MCVHLWWFSCCESWETYLQRASRPTCSNSTKGKGQYVLPVSTPAPQSPHPHQDTAMEGEGSLTSCFPQWGFEDSWGRCTSIICFSVKEVRKHVSNLFAPSLEKRFDCEGIWRQIWQRCLQTIFKMRRGSDMHQFKILIFSKWSSCKSEGYNYRLILNVLMRGASLPKNPSFKVASDFKTVISTFWEPKVLKVPKKPGQTGHGNTAKCMVCSIYIYVYYWHSCDFWVISILPFSEDSFEPQVGFLILLCR